MTPTASGAGLGEEEEPSCSGAAGGGGSGGGGAGVLASGGGEDPQSQAVAFVVDEFVPLIKCKEPTADFCPHAQPASACGGAALVTNGARPVGAILVSGESEGVGEGNGEDAAIVSSRAGLVKARWMLVCVCGGDDDDASMPAVEGVVGGCVVVARVVVVAS